MTCIGRVLLILVFCKVAGNERYTNPDRPLGRSKGPAQPGASRVSGSRLHGVVTTTECRSQEFWGQGVLGTPYVILDRLACDLIGFRQAPVSTCRRPWFATSHHITQRGNRRQQTFFCDEDCRSYLELTSSRHASIPSSPRRTRRRKGKRSTSTRWTRSSLRQRISPSA